MSIEITLPSGQKEVFNNSITGFDIAKRMGIAKEVLVIKINDKLCDLTTTINENSHIGFIKIKDPEGLEIIRHDAAHILAEAVKEIYPHVQVTIGPSIKDGFYYDFVKDEPFSQDDLEKIQKKMYEIVKRDEKFIRSLWTREQAKEFFKKQGEHYKCELIDAIPDGDEISIYQQGKFIDLCRGPHAPSTRYIKHFQLTKVSGAYWRGDSRNKMLQRIYGTAWATKEDLDHYLWTIKEAEKRDHRKIGKSLELFHIQEEARGMIFWHDRGVQILRIMEDYILKKIREQEYIEVRTPILVDKSLWVQSGHWDKFREHMFTSEVDKEHLALKPMNCPCHVQIFKQGIKSYRDLPLRMSEFGKCHRYEPSGALHGLMRVRGFVQDDAHIFCTEEQITSETIKFCSLLKGIYRDFGFNDVYIKFADRPDKRAGSDETWDKAEQSLLSAIESTNMEYTTNPGEGAFYGPKLEFVLKDAIGREWQCGTLQVDFVLPERLEAHYIASSGEKKHPVMLHRAILGSFERFLGILIENHAGKFPFWLSPVQIAVTRITDEFKDYSKKVYDLLSSKFRTMYDNSSEKISYKIRNLIMQKIPMIIVIGQKELESNSVVIRYRDKEQQDTIKLDNLVQFISENT